LRRASRNVEQVQSCCGVAPTRVVRCVTGACERMNTACRECAPFLTWGNAAAASCLLNQTEHAPDQGGTGGQQSSAKGLLLRRSTVIGSMDRGPHAPSLVGWSVFGRRVAPVARVLGSDLAGYGLAGLGWAVVALSITRPKRTHTTAHQGGCIVAGHGRSGVRSALVKPRCSGMSRTELANCDLCIRFVAVLWRVRVIKDGRAASEPFPLRQRTLQRDGAKAAGTRSSISFSRSTARATHPRFAV
jgi:hypothetical protein